MSTKKIIGDIIREEVENFTTNLSETETDVLMKGLNKVTDNKFNDNFWQWFGNSKVVYSNGKPAVVHHGQRYGNKFKIFNGANAIGWFAEDEGKAYGYNGYSGALYDVYLSIQNPFEITGDMDDKSSSVEEFEERIGFKLRWNKIKYNTENEIWQYVQKTMTSFQEQLLEMGYDGIHAYEDRYATWAVIKSPAQIKSVNNNGEYSLSSPNIMKENENDLLTEGLSDILYHFTHISNLISILKYNRFATSSNLGSTADSWKDKGRYYFFSTQRTKGMSGYGSHHGTVAIVLDGRKLNQTYKGFATDYWNWSKKMKDYSNKSDYINALKSEENEDRIVTNKPYIDNASKYIIEIHVEAKENDREFMTKEDMEAIIGYSKSYNIPVFFYDNERDFKLQNKVRAIAPENLNLQPKEKSDYNEKEGERELYNAKWFFKKIAPSIIAGNDIGGGYNDEKDAIEKLLKDMLEKGDEMGQYENILNDINEKTKRLGTSWGRMYADDEYRSMQAEIHNNRGNPNPYLRELLKMLINDMKKWRVKNLKEYFNKKFQAGIR